MDAVHLGAAGSSRIRVLRVSENATPRLQENQEARVYVTIGPGETRVTILDDDGICDMSWAAVFGWSALLGMPVGEGADCVTLEEEEALSKALLGPIRVYGRVIQTAAFKTAAIAQMRRALDDILGQTVGSGARFSAIIISAPSWLHDVVAGSQGLRPHILIDTDDF